MFHVFVEHMHDVPSLVIEADTKEEAFEIARDNGADFDRCPQCGDRLWKDYYGETWESWEEAVGDVGCLADTGYTVIRK